MYIFHRDFVKSTISSYKTTGELIEAIQEIDNPYPGGHPPETLYKGIMPEIPEKLRNDLHGAWDTTDEPDTKHD